MLPRFYFMLSGTSSAPNRRIHLAEIRTELSRRSLSIFSMFLRNNEDPLEIGLSNFQSKLSRYKFDRKLKTSWCLVLLFELIGGVCVSVCVCLCVCVWSKETVSERLVSNIKTSSDRDNVALPRLHTQTQTQTHTHTHTHNTHTRPDKRGEHFLVLLWCVKYIACVCVCLLDR